MKANGNKKIDITAAAPQIMGQILDDAGGGKLIGKRLLEDWDRTRNRAIARNGEDNIVEKRLQAYNKDILAKFFDMDRFHHDVGAKFEGIEHEDEVVIQAAKEAMIDAISSQPLFAARLLEAIRDSQPGIFQQLIQTGEVPEPHEVIEITYDPDSKSSTKIPCELLTLMGPPETQPLFKLVDGVPEEFDWPEPA